MHTSIPGGNIRKFTEEDIPQVADLHRRVFCVADQPSPELLQAYREYLSEVYLANPASGAGCESLVYDDGGSIGGFLGVVPFAMCLDGRSLHARMSSQFIVDPGRRGLVGVSLLRCFLKGPQDLSLADEANSDARSICQSLGGRFSSLFSMRWIYPLRPFRLGARLLLRKQRRLEAAVIPAITPLTAPLDKLASRFFVNISRNPTRFVEEDLTADGLAACLQDLPKSVLRPAHDSRSIAWLFERAARLQTHGSIRKVLLRTETGAVAGWYVYYLNPGRLSEVIQLYTRPRFGDAVLDHLFENAWRGGAAGLHGRLEPCMMDALSKKRCLFHCGPQWVLIHARDPELIRRFDRGETFYSRMDGEWCLRFR